MSVTMKDLFDLSNDELDTLSFEMASRGNLKASGLISQVKQYHHKRVKVVKGRKVPLGTEGECFWMGSYDHSKYGDPWGIYTTVRVGIKDDNGEVYWTNLNNVEVIG